MIRNQSRLIHHHPQLCFDENQSELHCSALNGRWDKLVSKEDLWVGSTLQCAGFDNRMQDLDKKSLLL